MSAAEDELARMKQIFTEFKRRKTLQTGVNALCMMEEDDSDYDNGRV